MYVSYTFPELIASFSPSFWRAVGMMFIVLVAIVIFAYLYMKDEEEMTDIKECPFCGGIPVIKEKYRNGVSNKKMYWMECEKCGMSQSHHDLSGYKSKGNAIKAWNKRQIGSDETMTNDEIKEVCYRIIDLIDYAERIEDFHDCNDCACKNTCKYAPKAGEQTRINCFAWVGENDETD